MKVVGFYILIVVFLFIIPLHSEDVKPNEQWKFDEVLGHKFWTLIDPDNHLVGGFYLTGFRILSPERIITFAPRGQGPSDLTDGRTAFWYKGDLAIMERPEKIKIFTKKNGTYVWKETKWLKRGKAIHHPKDALFYDNKIFIAGYAAYNSESLVFSLLKVFSPNGEKLTQLIDVKMKREKLNKFYLMRHFVNALRDDKVFLTKEHELKIHVVSAKHLKEVETVELEKPEFYKKMPDSFYSWNPKRNVKKNFQKDLEEWDMGYSSIQEVVVEGNHIVVQIRTANDKLKKFALLFYNRRNYKLEKTVLIDDLLLDAWKGKYYFFANGNPGRDEDTDDSIINIYQFK